MPVLEVKARRVGGSTYQVPMEVRAERRQTLGLRWLTAYARNRSERTMAEKLAAEIIDAKKQCRWRVQEKKKKRTEWQKRTRLLRITDIKPLKETQNAKRISA